MTFLNRQNQNRFRIMSRQHDQHELVLPDSEIKIIILLDLN